jgi:hypothetical protein
VRVDLDRDYLDEERFPSVHCSLQAYCPRLAESGARAFTRRKPKTKAWPLCQRRNPSVSYQHLLRPIDRTQRSIPFELVLSITTIELAELPQAIKTDRIEPYDFRKFHKGQHLIDEFALAQGDSPRFIAVDVETANADISSICQIAAVSFVGHRVVNVWQSLLDPEDLFAPFNVSLHGIDRAAVQRAPCFPEVLAELSSLLTGMTVASHTSFVSLRQACVTPGSLPC